MRVAVILPGLHRVVRGAEIAFEAIASELSEKHGCEVTLFGSGNSRPDEKYSFVHICNLDRKHFQDWPKLPIFRNEYIYEEFLFSLKLLQKYRSSDFDVTITCSYPFLNWILRFKRNRGYPKHIFVTQNSDHPSIANQSEYKFFGCDGLICTNPEYFERNKSNWTCELITNGVDANRFSPGKVDRKELDLPEDASIALMVSALIPSKRVIEGIKAVSLVQDLHLVVCGDGPERERIKVAGEELLPGRFHLKELPHSQMPDIYKAADVFMHLSLDEPFGNIYLEALASGLPIVSHDRDVTRWIVEDQAVLVDSKKTSEIARGLQDAFQLRDIESVSARRDLIDRRFEWSRIGSMYFSFMKNCLTEMI